MAPLLSYVRSSTPGRGHPTGDVDDGAPVPEQYLHPPRLPGRHGLLGAYGYSPKKQLKFPSSSPPARCSARGLPEVRGRLRAEDRGGDFPGRGRGRCGGGGALPRPLPAARAGSCRRGVAPIPSSDPRTSGLRPFLALRGRHEGGRISSFRKRSLAAGSRRQNRFGFLRKVLKCWFGSTIM
jgi:hypothetical protein